jgi:cyclopropane-fatty-acyl-phospholipid synthase
MIRQPDRLTAAAKCLFEHLAEQVDTKISIRLWDGSEVPLGRNVEPGLCISLSSPGVIGAFLRRPTPENLLRQYAQGHIDFHGADLYTFLETARVRNSRKRLRGVNKWLIARKLLPFLFTRSPAARIEHTFEGDESGRTRQVGDNRGFIQFHYDVSNEFYELFLDEEMLYTCAYFTDWNNTLEQAQRNKVDMVCRKLQLQPGERVLDIGCGWGGFMFHAARHYGVRAHGVTLSANQVSYIRDKARRLGLSDVVTAELKDYRDLTGEYDKIAAIGICEHVGIDNMTAYMATVRAMLPDRGMFLNHGITRPGKISMKQFRKMKPERRLLAKYIFPGGELDHLGHLVQSMEAVGFDVHDVEGWRDHYALTCRLWSRRLWERREDAVRLVGEEKYRMWLLYLAGVSFSLADGSARLYQIVASKHGSRGVSGMPPTREHLYAPRPEPALRRAG